MKNAIIGFIAILVLLLAGATISTVEGRTMRENEISSTLSTAMQQSMEILTLSKNYTIEDAEAYALDFIQNAMVKMNSESVYEVKIYTVDVDKGIMDAEVTEHYDQFFKEGEVSCRKVVILEDKDDNTEYFTVTFKKDSDTIKQISALKGDHLSGALLPQISGVDSWKLEGTDRVYTSTTIETVTVDGNMTFLAE